MKKISDYIFSSMRTSEHDFLHTGAEYLVLEDLRDLKKGDRVTFVGFDDVDNHYGVHVFTDAQGRVLEVPGDYASETHSAWTDLKKALVRADQEAPARN